MKEIGSEFWDVGPIGENNYLFSDSTQWFLSGRSALHAIIKELKNCHTVAVPSWCCDSMVKPFIDVGIEVRYYPVYFDGELVQIINYDSDILLIIDYFGYNDSISVSNNYKGIVIRDVTHSIFSATYTDADYYFGSLRKWCGIWTGGYAWARDGHKLITGSLDDYSYVTMREKAMELKSRYIYGRGVKDKYYLELFDKAEIALDCMGIAPAVERDVDLAHRLDLGFIQSRRRANAEVLRTAFSDWLIFPKLSVTDTPMFVPVLVPGGNRDRLKNHLIKNEIYCPVHWPVSVYHKLNKQESFIYDNELSLVCDQRYTEDDMYRLVETISTFGKGV